MNITLVASAFEPMPSALEVLEAVCNESSVQLLSTLIKEREHMHWAFQQSWLLNRNNWISVKMQKEAVI